MGAESPLARLDTLHLSRIQIFDQLVAPGPEARRPTAWSRSYLRVHQHASTATSTPTSTRICERIAAEADGWWGHCVGYPGTADRAAFRR